MTFKDCELFLHLITRTEMYTYMDEELLIVNYVHGYEAGRDGKCNFTEQVSKTLQNDFGINHGSTSWPGQIEEFARREKITWETAFKKLGLKVLSINFNFEEKTTYDEEFSYEIYEQNILKYFKFLVED